MRTDKLRRCISEGVHTKFRNTSLDSTYVFQKLNVIDEVWNEWFLPEISAYFAPFNVMKHKNEDLKWKYWLRMKDFWKGFRVKEVWVLSCRWLFYQNRISLFRRCISVNTWHAKVTDISKSRLKPSKMHLFTNALSIMRLTEYNRSCTNPSGQTRTKPTKTIRHSAETMQ